MDDAAARRDLRRRQLDSNTDRAEDAAAAARFQHGSATATTPSRRRTKEQLQIWRAEDAGLRDAQQAGSVPLVFHADVPVRVELGSFKLWKVTSRVRCDLVVDRLMDLSSPIKIKASNCKFSLKQ